MPRLALPIWSRATDIETVSAVASAFGSIVGAAAAVVAAVGIRVGIRSLNRADAARAAQASEDRRVTQAIMASLERQGAAPRNARACSRK